MRLSFTFLFIFLFGLKAYAGGGIGDYLYGFFIESYDFTSSCHRNVADYEFDEENLPTKKAKICYPDYLPNFLNLPELKEIYKDIEQWIWISESIKARTPLMREAESFYSRKIKELESADHLLDHDYGHKVMKNIKKHGLLSRTLDEIDILLKSCPEENKQQKNKLEQRRRAALEAIDLLIRDTPIISNEVLTPYLESEKEKKTTDFYSGSFKKDLIQSLKDAYELTSTRRKEYSQILGTGVILGNEVSRPQTGDEIKNYKTFINDTINKKHLVMELLATSAPENSPGFERLSAARCELQAKVWASDANQIKGAFYLHSLITIGSVGMASYLAPAGASMRSFAVGTELLVLSTDLGILGAEYLNKEEECQVYQNNLFLDGQSSDDYFECLEALNDLKINGLISLATGGLSTGIVMRGGLGKATKVARDAVPQGDLSLGPIVSLDEIFDPQRFNFSVGRMVNLNGNTVTIGKVFDGPIRGKSGEIFHPMIAVGEDYGKIKLSLIGAEKEGGKLKKMSSISFYVDEPYSYFDRRVLNIGYAQTNPKLRGRGSLTQLYKYIFETFNDPPFTAKSSFFISTNQEAFTRSLINQIDPDYFTRHPIDSSKRRVKQQQDVADAFKDCCAEIFFSMGKRNKAKYDELVQEAFKQTPSGRQTIEYFPRLCDNKVKWDPNSGYLSIKMLHCL